MLLHIFVCQECAKYVPKRAHIPYTINYQQNTYKTVGCCLPPFDSFLVLRGIKTLSVRLERQQENAKKIALWLKDRPEVKAVYYTGLPEHPGYEINQKQASGCGSMISFKVDSE